MGSSQDVCETARSYHWRRRLATTGMRTCACPITGTGHSAKHCYLCTEYTSTSLIHTTSTILVYLFNKPTHQNIQYTSTSLIHIHIYNTHPPLQNTSPSTILYTPTIYTSTYTIHIYLYSTNIPLQYTFTFPYKTALFANVCIS